MKEWFDNHQDKNPIIVAIDENKIIGWAALSKYSDKKAYSDTAELSLYVKEKYQGKGHGKKLMQNIIKEGGLSGLHSIISRITEGNEISVKIHEKNGFRVIGKYEEVGLKFGKRLDVILMQYIY